MVSHGSDARRGVNRNIPISPATLRALPLHPTGAIIIVCGHVIIKHYNNSLLIRMSGWQAARRPFPAKFESINEGTQ